MLEFAIWRSTTVFTEPYTPLGEFILWESLQQQKYPVAFDLYMTHQRLGVTWKMSEIIKNNQSDLEEWKPKTITNSQGQTQLVGTYIYE
jgi:hypothetical protein